MSLSKFEKVNQIQNLITYNSFKYKNEKVWPYIKLYICIHNDSNKVKSPKIGLVKRGIIGFFQWTNYVFSKKTFDVLMLSAGHYKVEENHLLFDKFLDAPINFCRANHIKFKVIDFFSHLQIPKNLSYKKDLLYYQHVIQFLSLFWRIEFLFSKHNIKGDFNSLQKYLDDFDLEFKINRKLYWNIFYLEKQSKFHLKTLKKHQVKKVILVCYYDLKSLALVKAANELNIPVVDIQHGLQGKFHQAYGGWPSDLIESSSLFPSHFMTWSQFDYDNIKHTFPNKTVLLGGNPWMEKRVKVSEKLYILFSSQGLEDGFPSLLIRTIKNYKGKLKWLIRLHPREKHNIDTIKKKFKAFGVLDKVEIYKPTNITLSEILSSTAIHITLYSSVVIEASYYKIPSIIIDENGIRNYKDQIDSNLLYYALDSEELEAVILNIENNLLSKDFTFIKEKDSSNNAIGKYLQDLINI